jgi:hypothetical protein
MNTTLSYASPSDTVRPPPNALRVVSLAMAGVSSAVGLGILLLYVIVDTEILPNLGIYWLLLGGVLTGAGFVCGVIYAFIAMSRNYPAPSSKRRASFAVLMPLLTVGVAALCVFLGVQAIAYHEQSIFIKNVGPESIDRVEIYTAAETRRVWSTEIRNLSAGVEKRIRTPNLRGDAIFMRVHVGDRSTPYTVDEFGFTGGVAKGPGKGRRYLLLDGLTGYANQQGDRPSAVTHATAAPINPPEP